jgi:hypothetical protein
VNRAGQIIVVDYKSTSKNGRIGIDAAWQESYKRQMEIYQWLLRRNGFVVSDAGYFVYCNGRRDRDRFDGRLEFDIYLIPYKGNDSWLEGCVEVAYERLNEEEIPQPHPDCDFCKYRAAASPLE